MTSLRRISLGFLALTRFLFGTTPTAAFAEPPARWKGNRASIEAYSNQYCIYSYVHA